MGTLIAERRHAPRIRLQIPIFIRGTDHNGVEFVELAKTLDLSGHGARLICPHRLRHGEIILLTVPAPLPSSPAYGESGTPPIHARVRRLESTGEMELVAVEFLQPLD